MVICASNLINGFLADILQEILCDGVESVAELELTPKQDPHFVGGIVHEVRGVGSAGPNAQHVLVSGNDGSEEGANAVRRDPRPKCVWGNEVAALGVELVAIDLEVPWRRVNWGQPCRANAVTYNCFLARYPAQVVHRLFRPC